MYNKVMRRHAISFTYAFSGLMHAVTTQPNFVVHLIISSVVVIAGFYFGITNLEWMVVVMTIGLGLAIELVNTSIESAVDLVTKKWRRLAKIAKDTASAAMLVYAMSAVVIGLIIFVPRIWKLFI